MEFKRRADEAILQLNEQGLNAKLYWENDDLAHTVSLVPTSAVSGEGVPDLLKVYFFWFLFFSYLISILMQFFFPRSLSDGYHPNPISSDGAVDVHGHSAVHGAGGEGDRRAGAYRGCSVGERNPA